MKSPLQGYFDFSRKEQLGLLTLVAIILACIVVLSFHENLFPKESVDSSVKEKELMAAIETERESKEKKYASHKNEKLDRPDKKRLADPFTFDPNALDEAGYVRLGFSEKQARSIRNYLDKGGRIRKVKDFKKLYVVNDFMYERLKGYIEISSHTAQENRIEKSDSNYSERKSKQFVDQKAEPKPTHAMVDINSASHDELMALRGIGPRYAERIVKYRDLLGGYSSLDQLGEVYGLKDYPEIIADLKTYMIVGERTSKKININTCEWVDLVRNPYIEKEVANSILAIRKTHGEYTKVSDITRSHLIDEALFERISPYLTVDSR